MAKTPIKDKSKITPFRKNAGPSDVANNLGQGIGNMLAAPFRAPTITDVLQGKTTEAAKARVLLITVSRQLFTALISVLGFGFLIILLSYYGSSGFEPKFEIGITAFMVIFMGILGGFIGIQRRLKELTIQDLELLATSRVYLCLAPLVGGLLAFVLYLLFVSGLLTGVMFPVFGPENPKIKDFSSLLMQYAEGGHLGYAKLMVWSFIAGFFEKFVTDVLGKFQGKAIKEIK